MGLTVEACLAKGPVFAIKGGLDRPTGEIRCLTPARPILN